MDTKRPLGFRLIIGFGIFMIAFMLLGQTMSFIDYDFTVSLGLQEHGDIVTAIGVAMNKGFGLADTIVYIPLVALGIAGLFMRRQWGVFAMMGAMGITAYWPIVCLSFIYFAKGAPGFAFTRYGAYTVLLSTISLIGIWGMWYLYSRRNCLVAQRRAGDASAEIDE